MERFRIAKSGQVFTVGDILRQLDEDFDIPDDDYLAVVSFVLLYLAFLLYLVTNVKRTANYIEI